MLTLLKDGYDKYMYNKRLCSGFPGEFSHFLKMHLQNKLHQKGYRIILPNIEIHL